MDLPTDWSDRCCDVIVLVYNPLKFKKRNKLNQFIKQDINYQY